MFKKFKNWLIKKLGGYTSNEFIEQKNLLSTSQSTVNLQANAMKHKDECIFGLQKELQQHKDTLKKYEDEHRFFTREIVYDSSSIVTATVTTSVSRRFFDENKTAISDMILAEFCKTKELKDCVRIVTADDPSTFEPTTKIKAELRLLNKN